MVNPGGAHAIAAGLTRPVEVEIVGPVGYYCAGMNKGGRVTIHGRCGWGVAEDILAGTVRVRGDAAEGAAATGKGGLVVVEGDAGARCGISMKGVDIVVKGSVGHMSGFMAQAGNLVVCGDADDDLGDSIYEARIYVRGKTGALGADCVEKEMTPEHTGALAKLLEKAGMACGTEGFRRYGSARKLYNFDIDNAENY